MQNSELFHEQIRLLYSNQLAIMLAHATGLIVTLTLFRNEVSSTNLAIWASLLCLVIALRFTLWQAYRVYQSRVKDTTWASLAVTGSILGGTIWALGSIMFYIPDSLSYQLVMLFILGAFANGSLVISAVYLPAHHGFLFPLQLPIMFYLLLQPGIDSKVLAMLPFIIIIVHLLISHSINRSIVASLKLRFENVELVEKLKTQKQQAEEANISKSRFLAATSHDLRQPLHALAMFIGILDERTTDTISKSVLDKLKSSFFSLEELFNSLLDISRLDAGIIVPRSITFDLNEILSQLKDEYIVNAQEKGLSLVIPDTEAIVKTDPVLLGTVLRNILGNAIRYTHSGEVRVKIQRTRDKRFVLQIIDTGIGISPDQQKMIFEEYYQINNPERDREKGLGLGLAIVKRILSILGLTYQLQSEPGAGSCFSIYISAGKRAESVMLDTKHNTTPEMELSRNVLLIDDERAICDGISLLMNEWGCRVETCETGENALRLIKNSVYRPDIIIADYRLRSNENGVDVINTIRKFLERDVPAVIISGDMAANVLRHVKENKLVFLGKPVKPAKLKTLLMRMA